MKYKTKSEREAQKRRQLELELRLAQMCIDFGNFILAKSKENANFEKVTLEDVNEFNRQAKG